MIDLATHSVGTNWYPQINLSNSTCQMVSVKEYLSNCHIVVGNFLEVVVGRYRLHCYRTVFLFER